MSTLQSHGSSAVVVELLRRVLELERAAVPLVFIPPDRTSYVPGQGFRAAILIAGEDSYRLTGTWPPDNSAEHTQPWFWGHSFDRAQAVADEHNQRLGVSPEETRLLVARSHVRALSARRRP